MSTASNTSKNVTKKDLIDRVMIQTGLKRPVVRSVVQELLDAVIDELANGQRIEMRDFGVFEIKHRAPRRAQNPKTLEKVDVPAKTSVRFKPGRLMKESVDRLSESMAKLSDVDEKDRETPIVEIAQNVRTPAT